MRIVSIAVVGLTLIGHAAAAQPALADPSCKAALQSLANEWAAIAYPMPVKPAQYRVLGRDGHENSGTEVTYMRTQIGLAKRDCAAHRGDSARQRISSVRAVIDPHAAVATATH